MKKFRVKNLTVAIGDTVQKKCGLNFSNPGCGFSFGCKPFTTHCDGITVHCFTGSVNCGPKYTLGCGTSIACVVSKGGCGLNYSTLPPTDFLDLVQQVQDVPEKLELIDVLTADLKQAMANLDGAKVELEKSALPTTLAEAKEVKQSLEGALKEVNGIMKSLK